MLQPTSGPEYADSYQIEWGTKRMKVNECIAQFLSDNGVSTVFGVMGGANMFYIDHFVRRLGGRYVAAAHEAGATLMAIGFASVSGKIGVASVTQGPAMANALPALLEGVRARLPVVLIAGDISSSKTPPPEPRAA